MFNAMKLVTFFKGDNTYYVRQTVQHEGAKVRQQRDRKQSVGQRGHRRARSETECVPDVMRQSLHRVVGRRRATGEEGQCREGSEDRRNMREGPNRSMRRELFTVEQAKVFWDFLVSPHGIGNAGTGVDTAKRRSDKRQEDGECLDQHKGFAVTAQ